MTNETLRDLRVAVTIAVPILAMFGLICFFLFGCQTEEDAVNMDDFSVSNTLTYEEPKLYFYELKEDVTLYCGKDKVYTVTCDDIRTMSREELHDMTTLAVLSITGGLSCFNEMCLRLLPKWITQRVQAQEEQKP